MAVLLDSENFPKKDVDLFVYSVYIIHMNIKENNNLTNQKTKGIIMEATIKVVGDRMMTYKQTSVGDVRSYEIMEPHVFTHKVEIELFDGQQFSCECSDANEAIKTANTLSEILSDFSKD
jgi:hypothetical protein